MGLDSDIEGSASVALLVREELARRRQSRQWLADQARVSLSTLEKALAGRRPFTLSTVVRIEQALGTSLRAPRSNGEPAAAMLAPESMGAYSRPAVQWLEGEYLTLRPSFSEPEAIYAYLTAISWDDRRGHLVFCEAARQDREYEQQGFVSFPHLSGHIYLVTETAGQYRMALLSRPAGEGALHGVLTTLAAGHGANLTPAAAPLALVPVGRIETKDLGVVREGDRCFADYRRHIDIVKTRGFAVFPG